jgi:hypothetical protein
MKILITLPTYSSDGDQILTRWIMTFLLIWLSPCVSCVFRVWKMNGVRHEPGGLFSVKSAYLVLEDKARLQSTLSGPRNNIVNLVRVWDSWAATKVIVFSWQLLQDRLPTRQNLRRRRVMVGAIADSCVFCWTVEESVDHLFVSCDRISHVWYRVTRLLGIEFVSPDSIMQVFESFSRLGVRRRVRLGMILVWHVVVWTIRTFRNDNIGGSSTIDNLVDKVKLSSWKWFLGKNPGNHCSFYE